MKALWPGCRFAGLRCCLRRFAVVTVAEVVRQIAGELAAVGGVAARLHDPVLDVEPVAQVVLARFLVDERSSFHPADVPFSDRGIQGFACSVIRSGVSEI